jgi:predicted amidohydrolase
MLARVPFAREQNRVAASVFRIKAPRMAAIYSRVFGKLAETYEVTIVAGSLTLPDPRVEDDLLVAGKGPLYNTTPVFGPDGKVHDALVRKVVPIDQEKPFITAAPKDELPVFDTPAGRLGILICADSWFPELYQVLEQRGAGLLAVPSYLAPDDSWDQPWGGYNGAAAPADIDPAHIGQISEGQAWLTYALAGRLAQTGIAHGINVFLRGRLWDLGADGHTVLRRGTDMHQAGHHDGAALINCWLA